jgi:hypothetical protein
MLRRLSGRTGLFFSQGFPILNADNKTVSLRIIVRRIGRPVLNEDESYTLQVTQDKIELVGNTDIGVLRGLETFLQLIASDDEGYYLPAVKIEDTPRFPWRGLMIDACRHFMPVEVVKRIEMAWQREDDVCTASDGDRDFGSSAKPFQNCTKWGQTVCIHSGTIQRCRKIRRSRASGWCRSLICPVMRTAG